MPKPYPDPNITTSQGLLEYTHNVTNGMITVMFMAAGSIILFMLFKRNLYRSSDSLAATALFMLIIGSFLWAMGFLMGRVLVFFLIMLVAGIIWSIFEK